MPHRILIVGGGFAGLKAARKLSRRDDVELTLVDRVNHHLFQPLLYQVAAGILSPGQIAPALRSMFRDRDNVSVVLGEVTDFDLQARTATVAAGETLTLPYDTLIVAAGATHSYFGHEEWAVDAPGMKSLADAQRLRTKILGAYEIAETIDGPDERREWTTFAIVGGGPTGVELAGQLAFLSRRMLKGEFRRFRSEDARIVLLDASPHLLGAFPEKLQHQAAEQLQTLGVEVQLQRLVTDVDDTGLTFEGGERLTARTVVWAAGVQASPLAGLLAAGGGAVLDRAGRIQLNPDLTLPGHPEVLCAGDMVGIAGVPGVAQAALQQGAHVARHVAARLDGTPTDAPFTYHDKGSMAVVGRSRAVASVKGVNLAGRFAWLMWAAVHIAFLIGWQNRLETVRRWFWDLLTNNRHERLVDAADIAHLEAPHRRESASVS